MNEIFIEVYEAKDFRKWLMKNHIKENSVLVILHKKHTGKMKTNAAELMKEAICFGWIDTTAKRIDEDRYCIKCKKRTKNSTWSYNTLSYAKKLIQEGKMSPEGIKWYKKGLKKKPHDFGLEKNPEMPGDLKRELDKIKNKKLKENFDKLAPSMKRVYYRWILRAKLHETKKKRINLILRNMKSGKNIFGKDV